MRHRRRFRFGDIKLDGNVRTKKIVGYSVSKPGSHITLNFGGKSGVIDVHRTNEKEGIRETLYAIDSAELPPLFRDIHSKTCPENFIHLVRDLSVGWMHHNHIGFVAGIVPNVPTDDVDVEITVESIRAKARAPEWLEDIYDIGDEPVFLFKARRGRKPKWIGIAFRVSYPGGGEGLYWLKLSELSRVADHIVAECGRIFERHGMSSADFLSRVRAHAPRWAPNSRQ